MDQRLMQERIAARKAAEDFLSCAEPHGDVTHFWKVVRDFALRYAPLPEVRLSPMTDLEVSQFEFEQIKFGKYVGEKIGNIPVNYLDWLVGQNDEFKSKLKRYVLNESVQERFRNEMPEDYEQ